MSHKICAWEHCGKIVNDKDKSVALRTYDKGKVIECKWFHFQCYLDWYNSKIMEKLNELSEKAQSIMLPIAKQMISQLNINKTQLEN